MDRRVKERLVGASILLVLMVLIAPELLSGPPNPAPAAAAPGLPVVSASEPVRNVTVDLATSKAPAPEHVDARAASSAEPQPAPPAREALSTPLETAAPPPTSAVTAAKPVVAGKGWAVQLGSFASHANADQLVRQLRAQGFSVYVLSGGSGTSQRYRVRIGPMADRGSATQVAARLKSLGYGGSLVPPAS